MGFRIDFSALGLDYLEARLKAVDPIPSQLPLLEGLSTKLRSLKKAGIRTLADLSSALKGAKGPAKLASLAGMEEEWLVLLRRAVDGFQPKPRPIVELPGLDAKIVAGLAKAGIRDTEELYDAALTQKERAALAWKAGVPLGTIEEAARLSDLCRIQWVNGTYARLLHDAGYPSPGSIARAKPEDVQVAVAAANARLGLSKTDIGLKDSARLVSLAGFLNQEMEA